MPAKPSSPVSPSATGNTPSRCSPEICRRASARLPRHTVGLPRRRVRRIPIRPLSADVFRPTSHKPLRPRRRFVQPGIFRVPSDCSRARRVTPVGAMHVAPPLEMIIQWDPLRCRREDRRSGDEIFHRRGGELLFGWFLFGHGDVARSFHEPRTVRWLLLSRPSKTRPRRHDGSDVRRASDHGRLSADRADRRAHRELTTGDPDHSRRRTGRTWSRTDRPGTFPTSVAAPGSATSSRPARTAQTTPALTSTRPARQSQPFAVVLDGPASRAIFHCFHDFADITIRNR